MKIKDWRPRKLRSQQKAPEPLGDFQEAMSQAEKVKRMLQKAIRFCCSQSSSWHQTLSDSKLSFPGARSPGVYAFKHLFLDPHSRGSDQQDGNKRCPHPMILQGRCPVSPVRETTGSS